MYMCRQARICVVNHPGLQQGYLTCKSRLNPRIFTGLTWSKCYVSMGGVCLAVVLSAAQHEHAVKSCTPLVIAGRQVVCKQSDEGKQLSKRVRTNRSAS